MIADPKLTQLLNVVLATTAAHDRALTARVQTFAAYEHRGLMIQAERDEYETAEALRRAEHRLCAYLLEQQQATVTDQAGSY